MIPPSNYDVIGIYFLTPVILDVMLIAGDIKLGMILLRVGGLILGKPAIYSWLTR